MIKFKEHDGLLFKMLEEPVPLRENDENVLVRFITHGVIGEYVKEHWLDCNQENVPIYIDDVDSDGDVTVWIDENRNSHHCCPFPMFEIIGTLVAEGSKDWALYQMMKGEKICHKEYPSIMYCESDYGIMRKEMRYNYVECCMSIPAWLNRVYDNGWQIYHEPKPLLADAKVGDLCKLRNETWTQIEHIFTICYPKRFRALNGWSYSIDGKAGDPAYNVNDDYDIISTEPLAPEGTKEWALQMMKLGKCVCHVKAPSIKYHRPTHYVKRVVRENCTDDMSDAVWVKGADSTGWQIYKEPKEEPLLADAKIGWRVLFSNNESRTIEDIVHHCDECMKLKAQEEE